MATPDAAASVLTDVQSCICSASLCGPVKGDGGTGEGGLGTGACTDTCMSGTPTKDPTCSACKTETLDPDGGACYGAVKSACGADPSCKSFLSCIGACPKK
jgi:hypothetical protein